MATLKVPERLGKYPITGVLGRGAMGIVYKGYDPVIKRPVAIKTIRKELLEDDDAGSSIAASGVSGQYASDTLSSRFQREAQAAGALNHPGIVSVYEYGEDASYAFIAMEYVEGNNLRDYIANGTTSTSRTRSASCRSCSTRCTTRTTPRSGTATSSRPTSW